MHDEDVSISHMGLPSRGPAVFAAPGPGFALHQTVFCPYFALQFREGVPIAFIAKTDPLLVSLIILTGVSLAATFYHNICGVLRVCANLDPSTTLSMFHPKAVDGRGIIAANALLLSVESHALPNDNLIWFAFGAPYCEGHLKSHDQSTLGLEVTSTCTQRVFARELVARREAFLIWWDIAEECSVWFIQLLFYRR